MITHRTVRAAVRGSAVSVALLPFVAAPAFADTPEAWADAPHVSVLDFLLVVLLIPAGIAVVLSLLTVLPSMIKGDSYRPGQPWRGEDEWFGGPGKAADGSAGADAASEQGGAGARF